MSERINRHAYQRLIDEDIDALNEALEESSLERQHIEHVLRWSVDAQYPDPHERVRTLEAELSNANLLLIDWQRNGIHKDHEMAELERKLKIATEALSRIVADCASLGYPRQKYQDLAEAALREIEN